MPGTIDRAVGLPGVSYAASAADEALSSAGVLREHYAGLFEALAISDLRGIAERLSRDVEAADLTFGSPPAPFPLDPVPRIFPAEEWSVLEAGLAQRVRALNAFVADAHGDRLIERAGHVPPWLLRESTWTEDGLQQLFAGQRSLIAVAGMDVVRDASGELMVLEDNLRTPSGAAYAVAARPIADRQLPIMAPPRRSVAVALEDFLRAALTAAAPDGREEPNIVLLSDGPGNSAWWEHRFLARMLDVPLVLPADLAVAGGRLHAYIGPGGRAVEVDVVYRRTDECRIRDRHGRLTWVAEALLEPCRRGRLGCVNFFGTGVADDKLAHAYVEEMIRFYLDQEPLIRSVRTYDPCDPVQRAEILDRIDELVVKPRDGFGGDGVIVCPHADPADRDRARRLVRDQPQRFVAQETIVISTHPTVIDGRLEPRHVDLRAFVFAGRDERVLPGGLSRMALGAGALVVNSSQRGGGKDTWVLS